MAFTIEDLREAKRKLDAVGEPFPEIRLSRAATGFPTADPHTDDMREYVERVGRVRVPAAFRFMEPLSGRDVLIVHPDLWRWKADDC